MLTGEVLRQLPGATKDWLYYMEYKGYISPRKRGAGKVERNDYREEELERLKLIWSYCQHGFPPKVAFQKAREHLEREKNRELVLV